MRMQRTLGLTRCSRGIDDDGRIVGRGIDRLKFVRAGCHLVVEILSALATLVHAENRFKLGKRLL